MGLNQKSEAQERAETSKQSRDRAKPGRPGRAGSRSVGSAGFGHSLALARGREPPPLLREALAQRPPRLPTETLAREVDGGAGVTGITGRGGQGFPARLDPADVLEGREHAVRGAAASTAEVEDLSHHVGGCGLDRSIDCVRDVSELAGLLAVAENLDCVAIDQRLHEPRERHVGPLTRAVNGEEADWSHAASL